MELQELVERFSIFDDWEERYAYLIELGRRLEPLEDEHKTEANRVRGCVSQVWLICEPRGDELHFRADSDAFIVKGLIAIVLAAYSDKTPQQIADTDIEAAFAEVGLDQHLSHNRRNGFFSMVQRIQGLAEAAASA